MSSVERHLISKILLTGDMSEVHDTRFQRKFFLDPDNRLAYDSITAHQTTYGQPPSPETFAKDYPAYRLTDAPDTMRYYLDEIVEAYQLSVLEIGITDAIESVEAGEAEETQTILRETLHDIIVDMATSRVTDVTQTGPERLKRYGEYKAREGALHGISSGFHSIDQATQGFQPKQLITFAGPPKAGKSTLLLLAAMAAHRAAYRPLFIGFEMTNEEQEERYDSIFSKVSFTDLRAGKLSTLEMRKIEKMMHRDEMMPPLLFSEDANSTLTVSGVAAQIERYNPDVVFIDGVYMMEDENGEPKGSPQALTNITRTFKQLAKNRVLPIVITTQVLEWKMSRKHGVTSAAVGYSSSFGQDSDVLISVEKTEDPDQNLLKILFGRSMKGMQTLVQWDWETGDFEEIEEREPTDVADAKY